ncbi:MAG: hypothetical protein LKF15_12960 [Lachnospiraceae bacterium]|nr:hypothetical protein [Lachnospiraceae bacterium]MCI6236994.1 hypothetical protein [Bacillota bacterium]MCI7533084.1 hypothetical protein [Lachnobacterium sp.]MCH4000220.1 hypothetical protein [Lachnospiraceae bacterium]MCH4028803.1 hypothetical protein [Lachnospiraceae bacterium]
MHEYSRILIEEYCFTHKTKKAEILSRLVEMSYDLSAEDTDADAIDLERLIQRERNPELKEALIDLDDFLFNY